MKIGRTEEAYVENGEVSKMEAVISVDWLLLFATHILS